MAATNNPMDTDGDGAEPEPVSSQTYHIAGILTTVYGLDLLPAASTCSSIAVLWLLHPRLQKHSCMAPVAASMIHAWYSSQSTPTTGLLCVSFDQRNHGSRSALPLANEAWRQGNPTHAVDMFGIYTGTAKDVSLLMDYLPAYLPCPIRESGTDAPGYEINRHLTLGISLGGHAAWHVLMHEPRVDVAVAVIGCPDYTSLMVDRAEKSKLESWTRSRGRDFVGSTDFPPALVKQIRTSDPAGMLLRRGQGLTPYDPPASEVRQDMQRLLAGKRILVLSGGQDKLVPYAMGAKFMAWLKAAVSQEPKGWFSDQGTVVEDIQDPQAGHEYSPLMKGEAARFIRESLAAPPQRVAASPSREAKI